MGSAALPGGKMVPVPGFLQRGANFLTLALCFCGQSGGGVDEIATMKQQYRCCIRHLPGQLSF